MATILIVEARFYPHLNDMLLAGALAAVEAAGHMHETLTVPGALELPGAIALAARSGRFCAFVALGAGFLVIAATTVMSAFGGGHAAITTAIASLGGSALGLAAGIAASLFRWRPSEAEMIYCEEMRDPEGEAIYDRAQARAAAVAAASAAASSQ